MLGLYHFGSQLKFFIPWWREQLCIQYKCVVPVMLRESLYSFHYAGNCIFAVYLQLTPRVAHDYIAKQETRLYLPHAIEVVLHTIKVGVVILKTETAGSVGV